MSGVLQHGVSRLTLIPVRKEPDHRTEQVTQLLFGDHYEVTDYSTNRQWMRIRIYADQYEGWIDARQHHDISKEYFDQINVANFKITTDVTASILYRKSPLTIVLGSIVPISGSELFKMEEQFAFNGEAKSLGQRRDFDYVKAMAYKYLNAPYQWGGKSPFGIDCSGLVQMVYKLAGHTLQRDAAQQYMQGKKLKNFDEIQPGDLVFFGKDNETVNHVGIALPDGKIIHASGHVRVDHLMEEGILQAETKIFTHLFTGARRIL
ncbi:MAG: NlpC/P60 family protein [Bacteroidota bacterium]